MERKFYTDNFEKMLKDHADDFKMYPSGKTWHGIYNNLHPGRRWPSLAMGIMLISLLLIVGRLNSDQERMSPALSMASQLQARSKTVSSYTAEKTQTNQDNKKIQDENNSTSTEVDHNNNTASLTENEALTEIDAFTETDAVKGKQPITYSTNSNSVAISVLQAQQEQGNEQETSREVPAKNTMQNTNDYADVTLTDLATDITTAEQDIASKADLKSKIAFPVDFKANDIMDSAKTAQLTALANIKIKRSRMSWKLHVAPSLTYRNFEREADDALPPNFSLAAGPNASTTANSLDHRMALGFELGSALMYDVTKKTRIKVGMQFNYTGYNIRAYSVHPINSNLILNNENGQAYYVSALSSYSSTPGPSPVTLHNQQLQLSIPVGLEFEFAQKGNVKFNAGASFQPTYVIVGTAYVSSANRKNYISESSLLRKWNYSTAVEAFVSWKTSNSLTFNLGPQFRYQMLSSYGRKYPHSEHLLDFGIKFGVSKSLR